MPETRHRTVLEVGLDDRGLRQLGPSLERSLNPRVAEQFEKAMERSVTALTKLVEQQTKLGKMLDEQAKRRTKHDDERRRRDRDDMASAARSGSFFGTLGAQMVMRGNQLAGQALPVNEGWLGQMLSGIPVVGPAFNAVMGAAQSFHQSFVGMQTARARAFGTTGLGGRGMSQMAGMGIQYGLGPTELPGSLAQIAQSTGLRGGGLTQAAPRALALQQLLGVDAGGIVNAAMTSGGDQERAIEAMSDAVSDGMESGLRDSRLTEVLSQVAGVVTQMRTQGIAIDVGSVTALMRGLSGLGPSFRGEAGGAAARAITTGMSSAPDRQGVVSALAIRNRMQTYGEDYETAARNIESNPSLAFNSVMGTLGRFRGTRGYETMLRTSFQQAGIQFSRAQAHDLSAGELGGAAAPGADLDARLAQARRESAGEFGTAAGEAGYQYQRARIGGNGAVGAAVMHLRQLELGVVQATLPGMATIANGIIGFVQGAVNAFRQGGMAGLVQYASEMLTQGLINTVRAATNVNVGAAGDAIARTGTGMYEGLSQGVGQALEDSGVIPEGSAGSAALGIMSGLAPQLMGTSDVLSNYMASGGASVSGLPADIGGGGAQKRVTTNPGAGGLQKRGGDDASKTTRVEITIIDRTQGGVDVAR